MIYFTKKKERRKKQIQFFSNLYRSHRTLFNKQLMKFAGHQEARNSGGDADAAGETAALAAAVHRVLGSVERLEADGAHERPLTAQVAPATEGPAPAIEGLARGSCHLRPESTVEDCTKCCEETIYNICQEYFFNKLICVWN